MNFLNKKLRAITLIELVISLFIIITVTSLVVMNHNVSFSDSNLSNSQNSLYQSFKVAQNNALSSRAYGSSTPTYWGIHLEKDDESSKLFADINDDQEYNGGEANSVSGGRNISFSDDILVNDILWVEDSDTYGTSSKISVLFQMSDANIKVFDIDDGYLDSESTWYIELKDKRFDFANLIVVDPPGRVDVKPCSCDNHLHYCCSFCSSSDDCIDPREDDACEGQSFINYYDYEYSLVAIGDQCWFAENLKYLPDGETFSPADTGSVFTPHYYVYNYAGGGGIDDLTGDDLDMYNTYGILYNGPAAMDGETQEESQGICPDGWHIPSHDEFTDLERAVCTLLGNSDCNSTFPKDTSTVGFRGTNEGDALKSEDTSSWCNASSACEDSGFDVLPAGGRGEAGAFFYLDEIAFFISSSVDVDTWYRSLHFDYSSIYRDEVEQNSGGSLRCVKNN
jgi:uncharacterized protein (TIGR02145 family)